MALTYEQLVSAADTLRDARAFARAADAYAAALAVRDRPDLRVQRANMLKDSGQLAEAEGEYTRALAGRPDDPDIHLQVGRVLTMMGRKAEAASVFRRALQLAPSDADVAAELARLGAFDLDWQRVGDLHGGALALAFEVDRLRRSLDDIMKRLPSIEAATAFPLSHWRALRGLYALPMPLEQKTNAPPIAIVLRCPPETALARLYRQIQAAQGQCNPNWTLTILGDNVAHEGAVTRVSTTDPRVDWRRGPSSVHAAWAAARAAAADRVLVLGAQHCLGDHAVTWLSAASQWCAADVVVFDEEYAEVDPFKGVIPVSGGMRGPFDIETLREANPWGSAMLVRRDLLAELAVDQASADVDPGSALLLAVARRSGRVVHVPLPLVWSDITEPIAAPNGDAHTRAVEADIAADGGEPRLNVSREAAIPDASGSWVPLIGARVSWASSGRERIGVVLPTRDNGADAEAFVSSLFKTAARPERLEVVVLDNGSHDPASLAALRRIAALPRCTVQRVDEPFNWSRLNNVAAQQLSAPLLVFANDDMEMRTTGWDDVVEGQLGRPDVGVIGARLLYPDLTIQHAGVLTGWRGSVVHDGLGRGLDEPGPGLRWHVTRRVAAVTGAFLATRATTFKALGGFDERALPIAYSDIEYCFKARKAGLHVVWTPRITALHHESKTRGLDHLDPEKHARNVAELAVMRSRWGEWLRADPFVGPLWADAAGGPFQFVRVPSVAEICHYIEAQCGVRGIAATPGTV